MKGTIEERLGFPAPEIQEKTVNTRLRNGLWNIFSDFLPYVHKYDSTHNQSNFIQQFFFVYWVTFLGNKKNQFPDRTKDLLDKIEKQFDRSDFLTFYKLLEFISQHFSQPKLTKSFNDALKSENAPFQFVGGILTRIIDCHEVTEIEKTLSLTSDFRYEGAKSHTEKALRILGDKEHPDYANSIKESISAVESLCKKLTGKPNAELGTALTELSKLVPLHGALISGYKSIYGYTSDADGIRHGMMDQSNVEQEDAIYMLVSCSAFINYLIAKSERAGLISKISSTTTT